MTGFEQVGAWLRRLVEITTSDGGSVAMVAVLTTVFLVSALAKSLAIETTMKALLDFGVGEKPSRSAAVAVVVCEMFIAVALLLVPPVGAPVAGAYLAATSVLLVRSLARGERFECNCFGSGSHEISGAMLARNALLIAMAIAASRAQSVVDVSREYLLPFISGSAGLGTAVTCLWLVRALGLTSELRREIRDMPLVSEGVGP